MRRGPREGKRSHGGRSRCGGDAERKRGGKGDILKKKTRNERKETRIENWTTADAGVGV